MSILHKQLVGGLAACCVTLAIPLVAFAQPGSGGMPGGPGHAHMQAGAGFHGAHMDGGRRGAEHGMRGHRGMRGERGMASMLRGLNLSEEQRDKVFAVRHAQAPQMRAKAKEMRNAARELRALTISENFDEAKAKALAETLSRSTAEIALIRSRSANEIYRTLTPEQRKQVQERAALRETRRANRGSGSRG